MFEFSFYEKCILHESQAIDQNYNRIICNQLFFVAQLNFEKKAVILWKTRRCFSLSTQNQVKTQEKLQVLIIKHCMLGRVVGEGENLAYDWRVSGVCTKAPKEQICPQTFVRYSTRSYPL